MTGFGAAARESPDAVASAEARSVNSRHLAVSIRAPSAFDARLAELETRVRGRVARGTVTVNVSVRTRRTAMPSRIDAAVLAEYLRQVADAGVPAGPEVMSQVLRLPGVVTEAAPATFGDAEFELLRDAVDAALSELVAMREREGAALAADLGGGADELARLTSVVVARAPLVVAAAKARLEERLAALLGDTSLTPELVAREVAVLADRSDVAEEVARLASHVTQWRDTLREGGPVGRRLDFLAQEMGREANTIGSKSQDETLARAVVDMKITIERLKEQAANVE